jgi:hypothetical protein
MDSATESTSYLEGFTVRTHTVARAWRDTVTHMSVSSVIERNDMEETLYISLYEFFHNDGNDITVATRRAYGGEWTIVPLEVPGVQISLAR